MTAQLFTFGYEGLTIERFVERLSRNGVEQVVDVRAMPLSRKRGFSKSAFGEAMAEVGIGYFHARDMGCPKDVRDRYKGDGNWTIYTAGFLKYLSGQSGAIDEVAKLVKQKVSCLVCFEADYRYCHRSYVARAIAQRTGQRISHITDQTVIFEPLGAAAA